LHPLESAAFSRRTQIADIARHLGGKGQFGPKAAL
jgi:hypothetical protein